MSAIPREILEKLNGLETSYFDKETLLSFFTALGSSVTVVQSLDVLLTKGSKVGTAKPFVKDGKVSLKDFLEFLYNERWVNDDSLPAASDVEKSAPSTSRSSGLYACRNGRNQYLLLKDGEVFTFKVAGDFKEISKRPVSPWLLRILPSWEISMSTDIELSDYVAINKAEVNLREEELGKLIGSEKLAELTKAHTFSMSLVGTFTDSFVNLQGDKARFSLSISKDGKVYFQYDGKSKEKELSNQYDLLDAYRSHVTSVSRPKGVLWSLLLKDGDFEVKPPALKFIRLANGQSFDLTHCLYTESAAVLIGNPISYHGKVLDAEGIECIVSFPGKYAEVFLQNACLSREMSVACVFLGNKDNAYGQHAENPEDSGKCYCHALYGERGHQQFGYSSPAEYEANLHRPIWGCLWFKRWRDNVEVARSRKQRLVAYFFEGQVDEGLVPWSKLQCKETNLWDGIGLGGSQKGELAFLKKMGYDYESRDVTLLNVSPLETT